MSNTMTFLNLWVLHIVIDNPFNKFQKPKPRWNLRFSLHNFCKLSDTKVANPNLYITVITSSWRGWAVQVWDQPGRAKSQLTLISSQPRKIL